MRKMDKRILKAFFLAAVIASILYAVSVTLSMLEPGTDPDVDKLAHAFALPYGVIVGTVLLTAECELYFTLKYFLYDKERKTAWRSVINGIGLALTSAFALFSLADVLFLSKGFYAIEDGILIVPAVILLRLVYFVIGQLKE